MKGPIICEKPPHHPCRCNACNTFTVFPNLVRTNSKLPRIPPAFSLHLYVWVFFTLRCLSFHFLSSFRFSLPSVSLFPTPALFHSCRIFFDDPKISFCLIGFSCARRGHKPRRAAALSRTASLSLRPSSRSSSKPDKPFAFQILSWV